MPVAVQQRATCGRSTYASPTVVVLRVTLVDGSFHDIEVPLDSADEAMETLRNNHIPFGDEWISTGYGSLVRRSAIISAMPVKLTADGERGHHHPNT
jgi:hypothetical protein